jgi:hypothetical protein
MERLKKIVRGGKEKSVCWKEDEKGGEFRRIKDKQRNGRNKRREDWMGRI